ncbi:Modification methylase HhaI [Serratia marcescens]|uniref:DNA cytosine methyltransferase n=1 Tax=Serratia marcescens TaxID=615 RepID=UPI0021788E39|nr:DNA cytosine methyltransferase [Serratia marcescens]CAI0722582.1 Modification methylase HhaI [Serratia marcescens]CAI0875283.1 Modification methylase HhaI [Serratia marcescens]
MTRAYYNEIDPYAAQWLRNLIAAGYIAPGDVDERSIEDVTPEDLRGYTQCHFFAGIGVWSYALRNAGWPDDKPVWTGSCPCQPFSAAGKGGGFDDERHLWPAFHWLIGECRPQHVFGEQVASGNANAWFDLVQADLEAMDYAFGLVPFPSAGVGAPHIRDRAYWVAHPNSQRLQGQRPNSDPERWQGSDVRQTGLCDRAGIADGVAYPERQQYEECLSGLAEGVGEEGHRKTVKPTGLCLPHRMADTNDNRQQPGTRGSCCGECTTEGDNHRGSCEVSGMADTSSGRWREKFPDTGRGAEGNGAREAVVSAGVVTNVTPSPTNGFWRSADWLLCRDEKWRPVRPGSFPLVDGATTRVGRLRAYGNAINAEAAKEFIAAYMMAGHYSE